MGFIPFMVEGVLLLSHLPLFDDDPLSAPPEAQGLNFPDFTDELEAPDSSLLPLRQIANIEDEPFGSGLQDFSRQTSNDLSQVRDTNLRGPEQDTPFDSQNLEGGLPFRGGTIPVNPSIAPISPIPPASTTDPTEDPTLPPVPPVSSIVFLTPGDDPFVTAGVVDRSILSDSTNIQDDPRTPWVEGLMDAVRNVSDNPSTTALNEANNSLTNVINVGQNWSLVANAFNPGLANGGIVSYEFFLKDDSGVFQSVGNASSALDGEVLVNYASYKFTAGESYETKVLVQDLIGNKALSFSSFRVNEAPAILAPGDTNPTGTPNILDNPVLGGDPTLDDPSTPYIEGQVDAVRNVSGQANTFSNLVAGNAPWEAIANAYDPDGSIARYDFWVKDNTGSFVSLTPDADSLTSGVITVNNKLLSLSAGDSYQLKVLVTDNNGAQAESFDLFKVNSAPTGLSDTLSVNEDEGLSFTKADLLLNDLDPDGGLLSVTSFTQTANGKLTFDALSQKFNYTPKADFNGTDSFFYEVKDEFGASDLAEVTINIIPVNDAPIANPDFFITKQDQDLNSLSVLGNDFDPEGDFLVVDTLLSDSSSTPEGGIVTFQPDGTFLYTPKLGFSGIDNFEYTIQDNNGGSSTAKITVLVSSATGTPPLAVDDIVVVDEDNSFTVNILNGKFINGGPLLDGSFLGQDLDPDGGILEILSLNGITDFTVPLNTTNGTITWDSNGSFNYVPKADFSGSETLTYSISDGQGGFDIAQVTIKILPTQDPTLGGIDAFAFPVLDPADTDTISAGSSLFFASDITDADGIASYSYKIGSGAEQSFTNLTALTNAINAEGSSLLPGSYELNLNVTDKLGEITNFTDNIIVSIAPPVAVLNIENNTTVGSFSGINVGELTNIDATSSFVGTNFNGNTIVKYEFDFENDGIIDFTDLNGTTTNTFTKGGLQEVRVVVYDQFGSSDQAIVAINANSGPNAIINTSGILQQNLPVGLLGSLSNDPDANLAEYEFQIFDSSGFLIDTISEQAGLEDGNIKFTFPTSGDFKVILTVTDQLGLSDTEERILAVGSKVTLPVVSIELTGSENKDPFNFVFNNTTKIAPNKLEPSFALFNNDGNYTKSFNGNIGISANKFLTFSGDFNGLDFGNGPNGGNSPFNPGTIPSLNIPTPNQIGSANLINQEITVKAILTPDLLANSQRLEFDLDGNGSIDYVEAKIDLNNDGIVDRNLFTFQGKQIIAPNSKLLVDLNDNGDATKITVSINPTVSFNTIQDAENYINNFDIAKSLAGGFGGNRLVAGTLENLTYSYYNSSNQLIDTQVISFYVDDAQGKYFGTNRGVDGLVRFETVDSDGKGLNFYNNIFEIPNSFQANINVFDIDGNVYLAGTGEQDKTSFFNNYSPLLNVNANFESKTVTGSIIKSTFNFDWEGFDTDGSIKEVYFDTDGDNVFEKLTSGIRPVITITSFGEGIQYRNALVIDNEGNANVTKLSFTTFSNDKGALETRFDDNRSKADIEPIQARANLGVGPSSLSLPSQAFDIEYGSTLLQSVGISDRTINISVGETFAFNISPEIDESLLFNPTTGESNLSVEFFAPKAESLIFLYESEQANYYSITREGVYNFVYRFDGGIDYNVEVIARDEGDFILNPFPNPFSPSTNSIEYLDIKNPITGLALSNFGSGSVTNSGVRAFTLKDYEYSKIEFFFNLDKTGYTAAGVGYWEDSKGQAGGSLGLAFDGNFDGIFSGQTFATSTGNLNLGARETRTVINNSFGGNNYEVVRIDSEQIIVYDSSKNIAPDIKLNLFSRATNPALPIPGIIAGGDDNYFTNSDILFVDALGSSDDFDYLNGPRGSGIEVISYKVYENGDNDNDGNLNEWNSSVFAFSSTTTNGVGGPFGAVGISSPGVGNWTIKAAATDIFGLIIEKNLDFTVVAAKGLSPLLDVYVEDSSGSKIAPYTTRGNLYQVSPIQFPFLAPYDTFREAEIYSLNDKSKIVFDASLSENKSGFIIDSIGYDLNDDRVFDFEEKRLAGDDTVFGTADDQFILIYNSTGEQETITQAQFDDAKLTLSRDKLPKFGNFQSRVTFSTVDNYEFTSFNDNWVINSPPETLNSGNLVAQVFQLDNGLSPAFSDRNGIERLTLLSILAVDDDLSTKDLLLDASSLADDRDNDFRDALTNTAAIGGGRGIAKYEFAWDSDGDGSLDAFYTESVGQVAGDGLFDGKHAINLTGKVTPSGEQDIRRFEFKIYDVFNEFITLTNSIAVNEAPEIVSFVGGQNGSLVAFSTVVKDDNALANPLFKSPFNNILAPDQGKANAFKYEFDFDNDGRIDYTEYSKNYLAYSFNDGRNTILIDDNAFSRQYFLDTNSNGYGINLADSSIGVTYKNIVEFSQDLQDYLFFGSYDGSIESYKDPAITQAQKDYLIQGGLIGFSYGLSDFLSQGGFESKIESYKDVVINQELTDYLEFSSNKEEFLDLVESYNSDPSSFVSYFDEFTNLVKFPNLLVTINDYVGDGNVLVTYSESGTYETKVTITDLYGASTSRIETVNVVGSVPSPSDVVLAQNDFASFEASSVYKLNVFANDMDPKYFDLLELKIISPLNSAYKVTNLGGGDLQITKIDGLNNYPLSDALVYEIFDVNGTSYGQAKASFVFDKNGVVVNSEEFTVDENSGPSVLNLLQNDSSLNGSKVRFSALNVIGGSAVIDENLQVIFTPDKNVNNETLSDGYASITYTVKNDIGSFATTTAKIFINPQDSQIDLRNQRLISDSQDAQFLLKNISNGDREIINIELIDGPDNGQIISVTGNIGSQNLGPLSELIVQNNVKGLNATDLTNLTVNYRANDGFFGEDKITYRVSDSSGNSDEVTLIYLSLPKDINLAVNDDKQSINLGLYDDNGTIFGRGDFSFGEIIRNDGFLPLLFPDRDFANNEFNYDSNFSRERFNRLIEHFNFWNFQTPSELNNNNPEVFTDVFNQLNEIDFESTAEPYVSLNRAIISLIAENNAPKEILDAANAYQAQTQALFNAYNAVYSPLAVSVASSSFNNLFGLQTNLQNFLNINTELNRDIQNNNFNIIYEYINSIPLPVLSLFPTSNTGFDSLNVDIDIAQNQAQNLLAEINFNGYTPDDYPLLETQFRSLRDAFVEVYNERVTQDFQGLVQGMEIILNNDPNLPDPVRTAANSYRDSIFSFYSSIDTIFSPLFQAVENSSYSELVDFVTSAEAFLNNLDGRQSDLANNLAIINDHLNNGDGRSYLRIDQIFVPSSSNVFIEPTGVGNWSYRLNLTQYLQNPGSPEDYNLSYITSNNLGGSGSANVEIDFSLPPLFAEDDSFSVTEEAINGIKFDLIENDFFNPYIEFLSLTPNSSSLIIETEQGGTVIFNPGLNAGAVYFAPANFSGSDSFNYTLNSIFPTQANGADKIGRVEIFVNNSNVVPIAVDDNFDLNRIQTVYLDILANDKNFSPNASNEITIIDQSFLGDIQVVDGKIEYIAGLSGTDTFSYTITNQAGQTSGIAFVTVNVPLKLGTGPDGNGETAQDDSYTIDEDSSDLLIDTLDLLTNDIGTDLSFDSLTEGTSNGTLINNNDGTFSYTPVENFFGTDTFLYKVTTPSGDFDYGLVNIIVNNIDDTPEAQSDNVSTNRNQDLLIDVLINDNLFGENDLQNILVFGNSRVSVIDNQVFYDADPDFFGLDTFSYRLEDNAGNLSEEVTVSVDNVNQNPIAETDTFFITEGMPQILDVLINDSDSDSGDVLSIISVSDATLGTLLINEDNTLTYVPKTGLSGSETLTYVVSDGYGGQTTGFIEINISAVNNAPIANDDQVSTLEDTSVQINVLTNGAADFDPDGSIILIQNLSNPANGTVVIDNAELGLVTYTPNENYSGSDSFTYEVLDNEGAVSIATVTINVEAVGDDAPVGTADSYSGLSDVSFNFSTLANDSDPDGDGLSINTFTLPSNGTLSFDQDSQQFTYKSALGFSGIVEFSYTSKDSSGLISEPTLVSLAISNSNNAPPVLSDDQANTNEGKAVLVNVLDNDLDPELALLDIVSLGKASNGSVFLQDGQVLYTPNAGYFGDDAFSYTVFDGVNTRSAQVKISILASDDAVDAINDELEVAEDSGAAFIDVLTNDNDFGDGDELSLVTNSQAKFGTVIRDGNGFIYTPNADFFGEDSFTYQMTDGNGNVDTAMVRIQIAAVDDIVDAIEDYTSVLEDGNVLVDVLANDDRFSDLDELSIVSVQPIAFSSGQNIEFDPDGNPVITNQISFTTGALEIIDGKVLYTAAENFYGIDQFQYTVSDGMGNFDTATVYVEVLPVDDGVLAVDDNFITLEDTALSINVLANDLDYGDLDKLSIASFTQANNGTLELKNNIFTFTPDANYFGTDSFTYKLIDNEGNFSSATVNIDVQSRPDGVLAQDDSALVLKNNPSAPIDVLANDTDFGDGDVLSVSPVFLQNPSSGSAVVLNNKIVFTPNNDFVGTDFLVYELTDDQGNVSSAKLTFTVRAEDRAGVANGDSFTVNRNGSTLLNVLANDSDPDGDPLKVLSSSQPTSGTVELQSDGQLKYTASKGSLGPDSFSYVIVDQAGNSSSAQVELKVIDNNPPLSAQDDLFFGYEDTVSSFNPLSNDKLGDRTDLKIELVTNPNNGSVQIDEKTGQFTYQPKDGFTGSELFSYKITDLEGNSSSANIKLNILADGDLKNGSTEEQPTLIQAIDDRFSVLEDKSIVLNVLANDALAGFAVSLSVTDSPNSGSLSLQRDGNLLYIPEPNFSGQDSFVYSIALANGEVDFGLVTIDVLAVDDAFAAQDDDFRFRPNAITNFRILDNDGDPDLGQSDQGIRVIGVSALAGGNPLLNKFFRPPILTLEADGSITFRSSNFFGIRSYTFSYTIENALGERDTANVVLRSQFGFSV